MYRNLFRGGELLPLLKDYKVVRKVLDYLGIRVILPGFE
jgi:hypothetical protein